MPGSGSSGTASIGTVVDKQWQRADDGVRKHLSSAVKFLRMLEARTGGVYSVAFVPTGIEEQKAIAKVFDTADQQLTLLRTQRTALDQQKRGLMQRLLTGKLRVKIVSK